MAALEGPLAQFVDNLAAALRKDASPAVQWEDAAAALNRMFGAPNALGPYLWLLEHGRGPWLLYQDPELGFIVTLLLKTRGGTTNVHNHGEAWSLYGIAQGQELIHRYGRDPISGTVRRYADHLLVAGDVEIEPAHTIHNETSGEAVDTLALVVRSRDLDGVVQESFDLETGAVTSRAGSPARPLPKR